MNQVVKNYQIHFFKVRSYCDGNGKIYLPEKTPNAEMTRNGDVAETMKAAAVVIDVNNIAIAERLK